MTRRTLVRALAALGFTGLMGVTGLVGGAHAGSFDDFFTAIKRNDVAALQELAAQGFDLNTTDASGQNALYLALRDQMFQVADFLARHPKFNVDQRNPKDETPLMYAVLKGHTDVARALVERGADVNKPGWAPLHYAATYAGKGAVEQVQWLLDNHAYIDAESPNGTTPLMMAAQYGSEDVVTLLLEEGADSALRNSLGLTAIDFALRAQRPAVAEAIAARTRKALPAGKW
ncbi:MAG TPA: ankyrin repeat domain-containing protein [Burkholderiaceae bacterium]|nr:ankyrin repeat domain-containing protein [Burkholderiaceae bacterium]